MDNNTQPTTPQPMPEVPQVPVSQGNSKTPMIIIGIVLFFIATAGMLYYILQPQSTPADTETISNAIPSPTSSAVAQTAEEQEIEEAVLYSLEEEFAELEKDLAQL